jgi:hypothetical protein
MKHKPFPFSELGNVRSFKSDVHSEDLQWHWDQQDRLITPLNDTDWLFQFDNKLPEVLVKGISFFIPAGSWHRLIKGSGDLNLEVHKYETNIRS